MLMFDSDAAEEPFCVNADTTELDEVCVTPVKLSPRFRTTFCELAPPVGVNVTTGGLGEIAFIEPSGLKDIVPVLPDKVPEDEGILLLQFQLLFDVFVNFNVNVCAEPRESNIVTEPVTMVASRLSSTFEANEFEFAVCVTAVGSKEKLIPSAAFVIPIGAGAAPPIVNMSPVTGSKVTAAVVGPDTATPDESNN